MNNGEYQEIVTLSGGPCSGQRFNVTGTTVEPVYVDFSNPALPILRQARYERIEGSDQAIYAGVVGGNADLCA